MLTLTFDLKLSTQFYISENLLINSVLGIELSIHPVLNVIHTSIYLQTTPEQFAQYPFPGAKDLSVMFQFYMSGKCSHDFETTRKLHPSVSTFEQWVDKNRDAFEAVCP